MKKTVVVLIFVLVVLNCVYSYGNERNTYKSYVYSSKYTKDKMTTDGVLFIYVNSSEFSMSRPLELELKKCFKEKGIKTYILSDYYDVETLTEEEWRNVLTYQKFRDKEDSFINDIVEVSFTDLYTYEMGGGISKLSTSFLLYELVGSTNKMKIVVQVISDENKMENYNSSWETVLKELSKSIVDEYCKYLEPVSKK